MLTYSYVLNEKPNSNYKIVEKTTQKTQKIQVKNYLNSTAETTMNHRLWIKPQLTGNTHKKGRTKKMATFYGKKLHWTLEIYRFRWYFEIKWIIAKRQFVIIYWAPRFTYRVDWTKHSI